MFHQEKRLCRRLSITVLKPVDADMAVARRISERGGELAHGHSEGFAEAADLGGGNLDGLSFSGAGHYARLRGTGRALLLMGRDRYV